MKNKNMINFDSMKDEIGYVQNIYQTQYETVKSHFDESSAYGEVVDAITFAPTPLFRTKENVKLESNFLGLTGLDCVVSAIDTCDDMISLIDDPEMIEADRTVIMNGMAQTLDGTQDTFNAIALSKISKIYNELLYGIWYMTADYLKYLTNDGVILENIDPNHTSYVMVRSGINVEILKSVRLYSQTSMVNSDKHVFNNFVNAITGIILPNIMNTIYSSINDMVIRTVYNSELLKSRFTPEEVNMIYYMVSDQLGHYMHTSWYDAMREISNVARYIHSYKIRTTPEFDQIKRNAYPSNEEY